MHEEPPSEQPDDVAPFAEDDRRTDGHKVTKSTVTPMKKDESGQGNVQAVFDTIKLVFSVFSVLFGLIIAVIGVFGWRTVSDIGTTVDSTVDRRIGQLIEGTAQETASLHSEITQLTADLESARRQIDQLLGGASEVATDLQFILDGQTDAEGDFQRLLRDLNQMPACNSIQISGSERS